MALGARFLKAWNIRRAIRLTPIILGARHDTSTNRSKLIAIGREGVEMSRCAKLKVARKWSLIQSSRIEVVSATDFVALRTRPM